MTVLRRTSAALGQPQDHHDSLLSLEAPIAPIEHPRDVLPGISRARGELRHRQIQVDHGLLYFFGVHCSFGNMVVPTSITDRFVSVKRKVPSG